MKGVRGDPETGPAGPAGSGVMGGEVAGGGVKPEEAVRRCSERLWRQLQGNLCMGVLQGHLRALRTAGKKMGAPEH